MLSGAGANATGERAAGSGFPAAAERAIDGWHLGDCDGKRLRSRVEYVPLCKGSCRRRRGLIDQGPAPAALIRGSSMHGSHLFGVAQCLSHVSSERRRGAGDQAAILTTESGACLCTVQIVCVTPAMAAIGAVDLAVSANAGRDFVEDYGLRYIIQPQGECAC